MRLKSIAVGSVSGTVSYIALILAPTWGWVFLGKCLHAIIRSPVGHSFGAFIAEESQEGSRAKVHGLVVIDKIWDILFSFAGNPLSVYLGGIVHMTAQQIGYLSSILGVAMMITYPAGHLADRHGERLAIALGFAM